MGLVVVVGAGPIQDLPRTIIDEINDVGAAWYPIRVSRRRKKL